MSSNAAVYEAFGGTDAVEVTITRQDARGAPIVVRGRCLTIAQAIRFMRLTELIEAGSPSAIEKLLDEFTEAAGLKDARVSPVEILQEVLPGFLSLRGIQPPRETLGTAELAKATVSASDGMS
jgi:hypothetical protein